MLANRSLKQILRALLGKQHYIALLNMFRVYNNVSDALGRYLLATGQYPVDISINTPIGIHDVRLYSHHDILTVNEIFCRNDYLADKEIRVVIDIGANIGISALYFLTRNDRSSCYLFEPNPANIERLRHQLSEFEGRFVLEECAIADRDGQVAFGVEDTGRYGGIGLDTGKNIVVNCHHINSILEKIIIKEGMIDIIKIDTEGAEIATINAINKELLQKVRSIFIEASPAEVLLPGKFKQRQYGSVCQLTNVDFSFV